MKTKHLEAIEIANKIVEAVADQQASDIMLLDTREVCSFTDYIIICSGESERQLDAIEHSIDDLLKTDKIKAHHREGNSKSGWLLIDFGVVIVHIFAPAEREYYQLERLWEKAPLIVRIL